MLGANERAAPPPRATARSWGQDFDSTTSYATVVPLTSWATSTSGRPVGDTSSETKANPSGDTAPAVVVHP